MKLKFPKLSPVVIGLLQASGFVTYAGLVGSLMTNGNKWFGPNPGILGPMLFLSLFVFSAIISALIILGYPFYLFWEKKDTKLAIKVVLFTAMWLLIFIVSLFLFLLK